MSSRTQAVVFFRPRWNVTKARKWLKDNKIKPMKGPDTKLFKNQIRFRIENPKKFKRFITKKTKDDVNFIIGFV